MTFSKSDTVHSLYRRFRDNLREILPDGITSVLIAYSGGADSAFLLHSFAKLAQEMPLTLHALHVNHLIRREANQDAAFCQTVCDEYGIPLKTVVKDVPAYAREHHMGLEEAARHLRYEALEAYRNELACDYIATAHNATDNTETVLFHLARGSALHGVCGISPIRSRIIRPLLPFSKKEILEAVEADGIPYCEDATNADRAYTRNYIRHEILPLMEEINPLLHDAVYRFSQNAKEDDDALYAIAQSYASSVDTQLLASLPNAVLKRVLLIKYRKIANNEVRNEHLEEACDKIRKAALSRFSGCITFPGNLLFAVDAMESAFYPTDLSGIDTPIPLSETSDFIIADQYRISVSENEPTDDALGKLKVSKSTLEKLSVRSRRNGDKYHQGNMTKSVKKMMCDHKIPQKRRDLLPIILYGDTILFITHLPISDLYSTLPLANEKAYWISIYQV